MLNKPRILAFLWIFIFFLLQNGLQFVFPDRAPLLLLIGVVFYGLSEGPVFGFCLGLYAGFFMDIFGVGKLGLQITFFGLLGLLSGCAKSKVFSESLPTAILFPAIAYYLLLCLNFITTRIFFEGGAEAPVVFREALSIQALILMAVLSPFIFSFLHRYTLGKRP